jgi:HEAT repeat protein
MTSLRLLLPAAVALGLAACATAPSPSTLKPSPRESAHLAVLASSAGVQEKARALQELGSVGTAAAVPALAALLDQEPLADYARNGLEGIADPSAGAALREALGRLRGRPLAGVVNSLGVRRDAAAVPALRVVALDPTRGVADEAVASLGLIGNAAAAQVLESILKNGPAERLLPAAHAALTAAERLAGEGNVPAARRLLDAVIQALPDSFPASVAKSQSAALARTARPTT